ncbi:MAG: DUF115 domain-containing protein [Betaproteobacteria bacterium]|nr:DUF115 domain-containing protein [Betaproteobacteria bacterium]
MKDAQETAGQADWTPLQSAYIEKLFATYRANLRFLHENFPGVFERLMATELPAPFTIGPDAAVTIFSGPYMGSLRDYTDLGRILFEQFKPQRKETRIWVEAGYLDEPRQITSHGENPDFFRPVEARFRGELVARFNEFCPDREKDRLERPAFGEQVLPLVLVFGSGFGWHLERLVDEYEIDHLFIIDTDVERLNLSLYFVDYIALNQRFMARGRSLSIAFHENNEIIAGSILSIIQKYAPPYVVQGAALFFHDYDSERVKDIWERVRANMGRLFRGWGFFDDEILGLRHAIENSLAKRPTFVGGKQVPEDGVAVIVGAGPSLDTLLPVLRQYREKLVVISCGTALSALANAGVDPDFHLEIERTAATYRVLDTPQTRAVLAHTPILTSAIMFPGVPGLSPEPAMFLKEIDFGSNMLDFQNRLPRIRTNPTCTNGGLDFVLKMGFQRVYLFGVDLGFLPEKNHHSLNSVYYNGIAKEGFLAQMVDNTHALHRDTTPVPGNFEETVLSTDQFMYSRDVMQVCVAEHPRAKVFNPNNGAKIAGAHSIRPEEIEIETSREAREQAIAAIKASFESGVTDDMVCNTTDLIEQFDAVIADLTVLFAQPITRKADLFARLADMHAYFFFKKHQEAQVFPLMRGTMQHMGRFAYDCFALMRDEQRAVEFGPVVFDLFLRFLRAGRENLVALRTLAETGSLPDPKEN